MQTLGGSIAVVCGGGSGIGRASAEALARSGMTVVVSDISEARIDEVVAAIRRDGGSASGQVCDVTRESALQRLHDDTLSEFGRINLLMNNVGVIPSGKFLDIPLSEWRRAFETNLMSYVTATRIFLPTLVASGDGHVVNTASTAGLYPYTADRLPYSSMKAAVISFSECLSLDVRDQGVFVTCLCPGPVITNIREQLQFHGQPNLRTPALPMMEPDAVGELVVQAVRDNVFLLHTHAEVQDILRARANDPEAFLSEQARLFRIDDEA